jgi:hypothetical protein
VRVAHTCDVGSAHAHSACAARGHAGHGLRAQRRRGPRPRPGGAARRAGDDTAPAHGRRRGRRLTDAETTTGDGGRGEAAGCGPGDAALDHGSRGASCRDDGGAREAAVGTRREGEVALSGGRAARGSCRDARRAVPTAALSRCIGAARGGHVAAVRCRAIPAKRATADKRGPLVSDFRIKNYPEGN